MLAELTRARIDKIALERIPSTLAMDNKIHDLNIFKEKGYPVEFQTEYDKQKKINRYLYGTLKHLNVTIDILIDQYDPVKTKNDEFKNNQKRIEREKYNDQFLMDRKLDEIKNSEKQYKNTAKEFASLMKKYEKVKNHKYLTNLYTSIEEDRISIIKIEKDNKKLAAN